MKHFPGLPAADARDFIKAGASSPDASIVIPAFNEEKRLPRLLGSVAATIANTTAKIELIVVDNASTDDTRGVAESYGATVITENNKGVSYARQAGLTHAQGKILFGTDADSTVPPTWLEALRHYNDAQTIGVRGRYEYDRVHPLYTVYSLATATLHQAIALLRQKGMTDTVTEAAMTGCNFSYRTEAARSIGYEPGTDYGEDALLGKRLGEKGHVHTDFSIKNTVITDGRRYQTALGVLKHIAFKLRLAATGRLYKADRGEQGFEDIR